MLKKLDHKHNILRIGLQGNFKDSRDSFYSISQEESWHITFVKVDDHIEEWLRKLVVMPGADDIFISDVEFKYVSNYKTMAGARGFVKKQADYAEFKLFIYRYLTQKILRNDYFRPNMYGAYEAPF